MPPDSIATSPLDAVINDITGSGSPGIMGRGLVQPTAPAPIEPDPVIKQLEGLNAKEPGRFTAVPAYAVPKLQAEIEAKQPSQFVKGAMSGAISNGTMAGSFIKGLGVLNDSQAFYDAGETLSKYSEGKNEGNEARVPRHTDIRTDSIGNTFSDFGAYIAHGTGSALGTSLPSLIAGSAATLATSYLGPLAVIPGFIAGAAAPSFIQNTGDLYKELTESVGVSDQVAAGKLTPKGIFKISLAAGVPMAALDAISLGTTIGAIPFQALKKTIYGRIAQGIATGFILEGSTEGIQQIIQESVLAMLGDKTPVGQRAVKVVDSVILGAFGGGAIGGPGHIAAGVRAANSDAVKLHRAAVAADTEGAQPAAAAQPPAGAAPAATPAQPAATAPVAVRPAPRGAISRALEQGIATEHANTAEAMVPTGSRVTIGMPNIPPMDVTVAGYTADGMQVQDDQGEIHTLPMNDPDVTVTPLAQAQPMAPIAETAEAAQSAVLDPIQSPEMAAVAPIDNGIAAAATPTAPRAPAPAAAVTLDRTIGEAQITMPDEAHASLFDLGQSRRVAQKDSNIGGERLDKVLADKRTAAANALGIPLEQVNAAADEYRNQVEQGAQAGATAPTYAPGAGDEAGKAWDGRDPQARQAILDATGVKRNAKVNWSSFSDAIKAKLRPHLTAGKAKEEATQPFAAESGTLGIPREEMPQIAAQSHGGLVKHINAQGIAHETKVVSAADLKPTQAEFSPEKVEAAKTAEGDRAVIVANDGHIIDGHHQVLAAQEQGKDVKAIVVDAPIGEALEAVKNSPSATVQWRGDKVPRAQIAGSIQAFTAAIAETNKTIATLEKSGEKGTAGRLGNLRNKLAGRQKLLNEAETALGMTPTVFEAPAQAEAAPAATTDKPAQGVKWFGTREKADNYIASQKLSATHEVKKEGKRFEIIKKADKAEPKAEKWKPIGTNRDGHPIFEDANGVRSYTEKGIRITEAVGIVPTREGGYVASVNRSREHEPDYTPVEQTAPDKGTPRKRNFPAYTTEQLRETLADDTRVRGMSPETVQMMRDEIAAREDGSSQVKVTPQIVPEATSAKNAQVASPAAVKSQDMGPHYAAGYNSAQAGEPRTLPSYFTDPANKNAKDWYRGFDARKAHEAAKPEHPGLVIKSLETGKETTIQPAGTVAPTAARSDIMFGSLSELVDYLNRSLSDRHVVSHQGGTVEIYEAGPDGKRVRTFMGAPERSVAAALVEKLNKAEPNLEAAPAEKAENSPKTSQKPAEYGAANKLVTQARADEIRAKLRDKLKNQINSGIDPEIIAMGTELAAYHIEAGARKFADFAKAVAADMGSTVGDLRKYLRSWYNGARDLLEDSGHDVAGMDSPDEVRAELKRLVETESSNERGGTDLFGPQALEEVAPAKDGGAKDSGQSGGGPARSGDAGAGGNRASDGEGLPGTRGAGGGSGAVHSVAAGGRRSGGVGKKGTRKDGTRVSEKPARGPVEVAPEDAPSVPATNFRITDETSLGEGSEGVKFRDNIAAIETLKHIEREQRRAEPAEQRALARYVGWGGLANAFPSPETGEHKADWKERGEQLAALLTPEELRAARRTTRNAHYTSKSVVDAMWAAAKRMGFKGGLTLESSLGSGNFIGLVPDDIAGSTRFIGVEYDSLTSRIARALYPQETVLHSGFQSVPMANGEFNLSIGNPPFGAESLRFQHKPELQGISIHNQFFLAALDALQPGGLHIAVVSHYLMDAQDSAARQAMAVKAELLGAIRLPDTAFKENARTEVVTDIVFMQRRTAADEAEIQAAVNASSEKPRKTPWGEQARLDLAKKIPAWVKTAKIKDPLGGEDITVNRYFAENPDKIMGRLERSGTMRAGGELNVKLDKGADLTAMLAAAVDTLPQNKIDLTQEAIDKGIERHKTLGESLALAIEGNEPGHVAFDEDGRLTQIAERETPSGDFEPTKRLVTPEMPWSRQLIMDDKGQWYRLTPKLDEKGQKVKSGRRIVYDRQYFPDNKVPVALQLGKPKYDRLVELTKLRDLTKRQIVLETEDAKTGMESNRTKLAAAYRGYIAKNGFLNDPANAQLLNEVPDGALLMSLESSYRSPVDAKKAARTGVSEAPASAKESAILTQRVVPKYEAPTKAENVSDAMLISLSERGKVDLGRMASLMGITEQSITEKLGEGDNPIAFFDPETKQWESRDSYLSGQVKRKLAAAKEAGLTKNAKELEAVQPEKWTAENVTAILGGNWIPKKTYADFANHMLGTNAAIVNYSPVTNSFILTADEIAAAKQAEWGTSHMPADKIIAGLLNSTVPKVYTPGEDGKNVFNKGESDLVVLKAKEISNAFADWVFADAARRNELVDIYNEKFNTRSLRQQDGSHLTMAGKVPDQIIKMRRHQLNAAWRGIHERFLLLDHVVGAGKTFTAIARAMERRRMGLSRKPMIVVPNHLVDQWAADIYRLYPGAKVLAAGKNQFDAQRRRRLFAKIATGDWDIVVMPHSSFGFIGISPDTELRFLDEELRVAQQAVVDAAEEADAAGHEGFRKPFTVKEAERLVTTIETRMEGLKNNKRDRMLTFEQIGVDDLTVDEAHEFKNLFYSSRLIGVNGMGNKSGSKKAFDLYNKTRVLRESPTGSINFMTGTPISNSAVEMYSMMRYLAADELKELGLEHFDAWRTQYVTADPAWEPTESGGLKEVTRLGRSWSNMRGLMELYRTFTDSVTQEDINKQYAEDNNGAKFPIPDVKGGTRQQILVKPTEAQVAKLEEVIGGFNGLPGISDPYERNKERLRLMDRARKVSLDVRAVDPHNKSDERGGKLDVIAQNVARLYKATDKDAGTQLIFLDRGVPKSKGDTKIIKEYDDLVAKRDEALAANDEGKFRDISDSLEKYDPNEMAELKAAQAGGWNAYDQLKKNLIALGLNPGEVRFVQEANNDAEKKTLFDSVNDGTTRVLIGSTQRMGAGTNVQERLVALHHGDVTWKPSDIEQREGRIIRQGNSLLAKYGDDFKVEIASYATERTVDAKMWDLNSQKLRMINGIRKYDGAFNMDFEDTDAVGMAEMAALASGDPLLLERVKTKGEVDKLEMQERNHRRKVYGIESAIDEADRRVKQYPGMATIADATSGAMRKALAAVDAEAGERSITIGGEKFSSQMMAAKHFRDLAKDQTDRPPLSGPIGMLV